MTFEEIVKTRRSVRKFKSEEIDPEAVKECLELATLAPNSSNLQLWEFYRIKTPSKRKEMIPFCLNQQAAQSAKEFVVVVTRADLWKSRRDKVYDSIKKSSKGNPDPKAKEYYDKLLPLLYSQGILGWWGMAKRIIAPFRKLGKPTMHEILPEDTRVVVHKSAALAAQTLMLALTSKGLSSCPMEGIDSYKVKKFLGLTRKAEVCMVLAIGKGDPEGIWGDRFRLPNEEVIFEVS